MARRARPAAGLRSAWNCRTAWGKLMMRATRGKKCCKTSRACVQPPVVSPEVKSHRRGVKWVVQCLSGAVFLSRVVS